MTQNKGKKSENSYQKLKSSRWTSTQTRKQNRNISIDTAVILNQKRANVCEQTTKMASLETHTETKSKYFDGHGRLSQSEESKCMRTQDKDGVVCSHTFALF